MNKKKYYAYVIFVIVVWGVAPVITSYFYNYLSGAVYSAICATINAIAFTIIARKRFKDLDKKAIKTAAIVGTFYSLAALMQVIGLQYTTPSMYIFLENTSCIVVPTLMFVLFRKKPHPVVALASVICLIGCFVLSGARLDNPWGIGEILCALAGAFYGVNFIGTGKLAKGIPIPLYLMMQNWIYAITSTIIMLGLANITSEGQPLEPMVFHWVPGLILLLIVYRLITSVLCWNLRTEALQNLDVTVVTTIMPLSALVTMVVSVLVGKDTLTVHLVVGAALILGAAILSGVGDILAGKKKPISSKH